MRSSLALPLAVAALALVAIVALLTNASQQGSSVELLQDPKWYEAHRHFVHHQILADAATVPGATDPAAAGGATAAGATDAAAAGGATAAPAAEGATTAAAAAPAEGATTAASNNDTPIDNLLNDENENQHFRIFAVGFSLVVFGAVFMLVTRRH